MRSHVTPTLRLTVGLLVALALAFTTAACGKDGGDADKPAASAKATDDGGKTKDDGAKATEAKDDAKAAEAGDDPALSEDDQAALADAFEDEAEVAITADNATSEADALEAALDKELGE